MSNSSDSQFVSDTSSSPVQEENLNVWDSNRSRGTENGPARRPKTDDPQMVLQGQVRKSRSSDSEVIVFEIPLVFFRMVCIVPIPDEGTDQAPVYVKFKVNHHAHQPR